MCPGVPSGGGESQNDDFLPRFGIYPLYTALQGTSIPKRFGTTLFRPLCGPSGGLCGTSQPCFAASRCHPGISKVVSASRSHPGISKGISASRHAPGIRKGISASRCHPGISKVVSASRRPHRPRRPRWRRGGFLCGRKSGGDLQPHASTSRQNQKDGDRGPRGRLRISGR